MMELKNKKLIQDLVEDLKPVKPVRFSRLILLWLFLSFLSSATILAFLGMRSDLNAQMQTHAFWTSFIAFFAAMFVCLVMTLRLSIPGLEPKSKKPIGLSLFLLAYLPAHFILISEFSYENLIQNLNHGFECTLAIVLIALVPFIVIQIFIAKLFPMRIFFVAWHSGFAALWLGSLALQTHCMNDSGLHILLWHYLSVAIFSIVVFLPIAWMILRKKEQA